jgi:hypothetical protein
MQLEEAAFPCPCLRPGLENEQAIGGVAEALLSGHVAEGAEVFLVRVESVRAGVTDDTYGCMTLKDIFLIKIKIFLLKSSFS